MSPEIFSMKNKIFLQVRYEAYNQDLALVSDKTWDDVWDYIHIHEFVQIRNQILDQMEENTK